MTITPKLISSLHPHHNTNANDNTAIITSGMMNINSTALRRKCGETHSFVSVVLHMLLIRHPPHISFSSLFIVGVSFVFTKIA